MSQRNLLILSLAVALSFACYMRGEQNPYARYVADGLAAIEQGSLEAAPSRELFGGAMEGMIGVLRRHGDAHSQFLSEEEADPLRTEIRQQFGGIGVRLGFEGDPPRLVIVGPPDPGGPAARANLLPGDHILAIDDQPTRAMSMGHVLRRMRGQPGTKVLLSIQQEHKPGPRTVELVREIISIESVLGDRRRADGTWEFQLADDPRIAHVRVAAFGDLTAPELRRVLENVTAAGVEAVALDLRDNAGGALEAAVAVCNILLPAGKTVVETRTRDNKLRQRYATTGDGRFVHLPLAVLVNRNSASAAEIVAACLQDHRRAVVVGERTFGKGTVQQLVSLESGKSILKLTWAYFLRPSGAKIHRAIAGPEEAIWGVVPEPGRERRLSPEEYATYQKYRTDRDLSSNIEPTGAAVGSEHSVSPEFADEQLQLAIDYLRGKLD